MEEKSPRGRPGTKWINQIRKDIETRREIWEEMQENREWENRQGITCPYVIFS